MFELVKPPPEVLTVPLQLSPIVPLWLVLMVALPLGLTLLFLAIRFKHRIKYIALLFILFSALLPSVPMVHAPDFGTPLNLANIELFAYYNETSNWTLSDTVPAFRNFTDYGNYYDGYVRVWHDATGNNYVGADIYVDIKVRVRGDGWILAWMDSTYTDTKDIPYWGATRGNHPPIPDNSTILHRAIERVYYVSGKGFPGYDQLNLYDFSVPNAEMLVLINGYGVYTGYPRFLFFTVPSASIIAVEQSTMSQCGQLADNDFLNLYYNDGLIYNETSSAGPGILQPIGPFEYNIAIALDAVNNVTMTMQKIGGSLSSLEEKVVVMIWMR